MLTRKAVPLLTLPRSSLLTNLVAYYKFADANDSHTNGLNLTAVNSPTYVAGQVGNCVSLVSASNQYLSSASGSFAIGSNSAWWSVWVRAATLGSGHGILGKYGGGGGGYLLYVGAAQPPELLVVLGDTTTLVRATWGANISAVTWYHIYCQFNATTRKAGISIDNGTLVESTALAAGSIGTSPNPFQVGYDPATGSPTYFNGLIDELAFGVGAVLTTTQRTNLYTAQLAGTGSYPFIGIP